jgi:proteasome lid subunit RPN8/RPN11
MPLLTATPGMLDATFDHFRRCGAGRRECVAYWTGPVDTPARVDRVEHPRHRATRSQYEVDSGWVTDLFLRLRGERRTVRLQVHTHPGRASHSETDDRFAIVPAPGFLSLVIPDFAVGPIGLDRAVLVGMDDQGEWAPWSITDVEAPVEAAES